MTNATTTYSQVEWSVLRILDYYRPQLVDEAVLIREAGLRGHFNSKDMLTDAVNALCESEALERIIPAPMSGKGYKYRLMDTHAPKEADEQWAGKILPQPLSTASEMFLRCIAKGDANSEQVRERLMAAGLTNGEVSNAFRYCVSNHELASEHSHGMMSPTPSALSLTSKGIMALDTIGVMAKIGL